MIVRPWGFKAENVDGGSGGLGWRIDRLFVAPRGRCSIHRHGKASHLLCVAFGSAWLDIYGDVLDIGRLSPDAYEIPASPRLVAVNPGVIHRFRAGDEGAVINEILFDWSEGDIERFSEGGGGR